MVVITIRRRETLLFLIFVSTIYAFLFCLFRLFTLMEPNNPPHFPENINVVVISTDDQETILEMPQTGGEQTASPDTGQPHESPSEDHDHPVNGMSLVQLLKANHSNRPLKRKTKAEFQKIKKSLVKLVTILSKLPLFNIDAKSNSLVAPKKNNDFPKVTSQPPETKNNKTSIVIATSICNEFWTEGPMIKSLMMIKSVLVSARLFQKAISRVDIHVFIDFADDELIIKNTLLKLGANLSDIAVDIHIHPLKNLMPKHHKPDHMLYEENTKCNYAPMFLPTVLKRVDSVLYLDMYTIVTGNLAEIWKHFREFDSEQLVGMARETQEENVEITEEFGDIPRPLPTGVNAGIILMNLTRMRHYNWEQKLLHFHSNHSLQKAQPLTSFTHVQNLINGLLHYSDNLLYHLPCQLNFRTSHCSLDEDDLCAECDCDSDRLGIQVIYDSTGQHLEIDDGIFYSLFKAYEKVNLLNNATNKQLIIPVKSMFASMNDKTSPPDYNNACFETFNKFMFRNFFP